MKLTQCTFKYFINKYYHPNIQINLPNKLLQFANTSIDISDGLIEDIEKMEALGIYEVVPEDFGLIDYANTSKIEAQEIIRKGIELMINEVG